MPQTGKSHIIIKRAYPWYQIEARGLAGFGYWLYDMYTSYVVLRWLRTANELARRGMMMI